MTQTIIGIDPGLNGAVAVLCGDGPLEVWRTPTLTATTTRGERKFYDEGPMRDMLTHWESPTACIEEAHVRPIRRKGKDGQLLPVGPGQLIDAGRLMYGYGLWRGMLTALRIPYMEVPPRVWQKVMLVGMPKGDTKMASIRVAQHLWPDESFKRTERCRKPDDGMADAALIAEWYRRQLTGA